MVVPPAPDSADALTGSQETGSTHDSTQASAPGPFSGGGWRLPLLVVLLVAVLAAGGVFAWLLAGRAGDVDEQQQRRDDVMAQSEQFMLRMGTFGPDMLSGEGTMPEYRDQVTEVITPKFSESFDQQVSVAEQLVAQSDLSRGAEVFSTGVTSADQDSAQALVAGSFTDSYADDRGRPYPFRIRLELVKVEGEWLVDDFAPVTQDDEGETGVPGEQPQQSPQPQPDGSGSGGSGGSGGGQ